MRLWHCDKKKDFFLAALAEHGVWWRTAVSSVVVVGGLMVVAAELAGLVAPLAEFPGQVEEEAGGLVVNSWLAELLF